MEIGFAYKNKIMVDIYLQKKVLKIELKATFRSLDDSKYIARNVSNIVDMG